ncbi:apolipoprotein N-acyltransferase [Litoribrevibacter albus]|uniref:Apolipoprotein N-acyltransferase n=1 Tax=Litoribrevibacter albus TaxID=1473156 RepID=A0AA37SEL0_9GAMM|nr:apolipoprotein N-acyltransferase [Litoribrevibacter albus]GLQ33713.1 apolipoprotein N-acyltransferase [Litoribrevibacter albus]
MISKTSSKHVSSSSLLTRIQERLTTSKLNMLKLISSFLLGCLLPLSFAPFDYWPLAILSLALFQWLLDTTETSKSAFKLGWSYGFGVFVIGASWVYVSIHDYGYAPIPLALLMTGLFTFLLGLFFAFQSYCYKKWFTSSPLINALSFSVIWVLFEWLRSWFLTGFPWLYLGYGHIESWLSGWAPILGVFGVSLVVALSASAVKLCLVKRTCGRHAYFIAAAILLWPLGFLLSQVSWTTPKAELSVSLMQGNIPQEKKWQNEYRPVSLSTYRQLNRNAPSDLIIWPETAIPYFKHQIGDWLAETEQELKPEQGLITGIPYYDKNSAPNAPVLHNTVIGLGAASGQYHKQKLVPFGEYVPLQDLLRGLIQFFNLPMSNFRPGPTGQAPLKFREFTLWPAICYEIAYPAFIARHIDHQNQQQDFIVTISNDAWFGDSIGPKQHLQIAQMRALENSRVVLRATNTGLTAVIDEKGRITHALPDFIEGGLNAKVQAQQGLTPYSQWLNYPVLAFIALSLLGILLYPRISRDQKA